MNRLQTPSLRFIYHRFALCTTFCLPVLFVGCALSCCAGEAAKSVRQPDMRKTITLSGYTVQMSGPPVRLNRGVIRYWQSIGSTATWNVVTSHEGWVDVSVVAAVESPFDGCSFALQIGDQTVTGKLPNTGGWESYQQIDLGSVHLTAGQHTVRLQPTDLPHGVFGNLRSVRLTGEFLLPEDTEGGTDFTGPVKVFETSQPRGSRLAQQNSLKHLAKLSADATTIMVEGSKRFQTIEGFGGAFTESAGIVFSKLSPARQRELITAYFDQEQGHRYRLCRTHINSCDFSTGNYAYDEVAGDVQLRHFSIEHDRQYLIPLIHAAQQAAAPEKIKLLASPWSPPAWMKTNGSMTGGGRLKPEYRDAWARYYCRYIEEYANEGIDIWGISVQNEPDAVQRWESCIYSAEEERDFVRDYLGPSLRRNGMEDVRLLVWDHNRDQLFDRAKTVFDDPQAAQYVWGAGFHWYVSDEYHHAQMVSDFYPDKKLLFTEGCLEGGPNILDWSGGEHYAKSIINDLNHGAVGWIDWNILLDTEGGPNHVDNFCSAPILADLESDRLIYNSSYYYFGHFTRFIKVGAQRVLCGNTGTELLTTAFQNADGTVVVVILNQQDYPIRYSLRIGQFQTESLIGEHSIVTLTMEEDRIQHR